MVPDRNYAGKLLNMEIKIDDLRFVNLKSTWRSDMISSPFTRIYMIKAGKGIIHTEKDTTELLPGKLYVIPYGTRFSYECDNFLDKIYIHFNALLPDKSDVFESANQIFCFDDTENLENYAESLLPPDNAIKILGLKTIVQKIALDCIKQLDNKEITGYSDYVKNVVSYIEQHLGTEITAQKIAEELFTSTAKIRKTFKSETGISIGKYINERIMNRAELMVRSTKAPFKEISDSLGFCDQFYFSRCFSKKYGVPPHVYRKIQS